MEDLLKTLINHMTKVRQSTCKIDTHYVNVMVFDSFWYKSKMKR